MHTAETRDINYRHDENAADDQTIIINPRAEKICRYGLNNLFLTCLG